jgi:tripartite-type tricarboxylate transporter receptor subunit TctC
MKLAKTALAFVVSLLALGTGAHAQSSNYPGQAVKLIVPFSAGSATDILARILAEKLAVMWSQTVLVENRPGIPGTVAAAKSPADGYTFMVTTNGHTIVGALNKDLPIDPLNDFTGVAEVASIPLVLTVTPAMTAADFKQFVTLAKTSPGKLNFASAGLASSTYLAGELLKQTAKIDIVHVPYRGTPEQITSLIRGDAQLGMAFLSNVASYIQSGQVRALAITTAQRYAGLPDVPTFAEAGLPEYRYDSWFGVLALAKTPASIVKKVSADIATVLKMPDVEKRLQTLGAVPVGNTPEEFEAIIRADTERYGRLLKAAGVGMN